MLKRFTSSQKIQNKTALPRLKFSRTLDSAYLEGKLHPTLDGLLHFLHFNGNIDEFRKISLSRYETEMKHRLMILIKNGGLKHIDIDALSAEVVLAIIRSFIKALRRRPLSKIDKEDWNQFHYNMPQLSDPPLDRQRKTTHSITKAKQMMNCLKSDPLNFVTILLRTLNALCSRSGDLATTAMRIAEFMATELLYNKPKKILSAKVRADAQISIRFILFHTPQIFGSSDIVFQNILPVRNRVNPYQMDQGFEAMESAFLNENVNTTENSQEKVAEEKDGEKENEKQEERVKEKGDEKQEGKDDEKQEEKEDEKQEEKEEEKL